ncbi:MAG TPA: hypothetical protein VE967_07065 [Gemmatimonadaceae bacterium]|nr:hypothetical protein [Gemmatimonadaceae bacterium]
MIRHIASSIPAKGRRAAFLLLSVCACTRAEPTRVLFIGNSYTFTNDMPAMLTELSRAGGHLVVTRTAAEGGTTLGAHVRNPATRRALDSLRWDHVVLQEQSQIPSVEPSRSVAMFPAVRELVGRVRTNGAAPLLFVTWAHRDGWPENGLADAAAMQAAIDTGYATIGRELSVARAGVGDAWMHLQSEHPEIALWSPDGSHPTVAGSYLAACVFYVAIFHEKALGLPAIRGLDPAAARVIRAEADRTHH